MVARERKKGARYGAPSRRFPKARGSEQNIGVMMFSFTLPGSDTLSHYVRHQTIDNMP